MERFFILVSEPQPLTLLNSIFYAVDVDLKSRYKKPLPQIQFKTKLYFEIKPVSRRDRDTYQIRSTYMVSRPNHIKRYQCILHEYSANLLSSLGDLEKLEQFPKLSQWQLKCLDCEGYAGKKSVDLTVFKILAPNSTIVRNPTSKPQFPNPILIIKEASQKQQLLKFQQGYHFVTCAQPYVDKTWKFIILLQAFDHATWFFILISCIGSGIVVLLILRYKKDKYALLNPTATITFAFNLLLDHHSLVMNKCKWIGGPWLLIVIVLIGGYEGLTIGRITSPDPLRKFDNFQQLVQKRFRIYSQNMFPFSVVQKMPSFMRNEFFKNLAESGPNEYYRSSFDTYFKQNSISLNNYLIEQIDKLIVRPEGLGEAINMGRQYYLVYLLQQCQNTAVIGDFDSVSDMYLALKKRLIYSDTKIGLSFSRSFETVSKSWLFYYVPWSVNTYIRKVNSLAQSGLADLWVNLKREKSDRQIRSTELAGVKPLARNGKILIVFYLHGILVLIALVSFLVEIRKKNIPFVTELGSRLKVGDKITIAGTILPTASSFTINLRNNHQQEGNTILLHFNVRFFSPNYVVLNSHISGFGWLNEERKAAPFSLRKGYPFQIDILCEEEEFLVSVDGQPFHEYKYRLPLEGANVLEISGGDRLEVFLVDVN
ncbi:unnamed protein product [Orchesella dallaii]|uniref:Galectin domain-containing protein n=1 Tax=Orchesella dallaii TaxID=48710 RepID=A0ABP1S964_9HEXA